MRQIEQVFLREVVRTFRRQLGYQKLSDLIPEIERRARALNYDLDHEICEKYLYNHAVAERLTALSEIALEMISERRAAVIDGLRDEEGPAAADYLSSILNANGRGALPEPSRREPIIENVFNQWRNSHARGTRTLKSGVYQVFRRYKPIKPGSAADDVLIVELFYVDSDGLEAVLVTSEGNLYWGSLHINHRTTLYGLLQRPYEFSETNRPISQRFYTVNIKPHGGLQKPLYSGLYIKTGDHTELPLAGDCVFLQVLAHGHEPLHERMKELLRMEFSDHNVRDDEVIMDYIASYDELDADASPPVRIPDVPFINNLLKANTGHGPLFRQPSRTLPSPDITQLARSHPLTIFRRTILDPQPTLFD